MFQEGESQPGEFPWQAAILRPGRNVGEFLFLGGGSLIHPQVSTDRMAMVRYRITYR